MQRARSHGDVLTRSERLALLALLGFAACAALADVVARGHALQRRPASSSRSRSRRAAGDWAAILAHPYHPLYSLSIAARARPRASTGRARARWSASPAVPPPSASLFLFLRDAFGAPAAWIGAGLLAVHSRARRVLVGRPERRSLSRSLPGGRVVRLARVDAASSRQRRGGGARVGTRLPHAARRSGPRAASWWRSRRLEWLRGTWRAAPALRIAGGVAAGGCALRRAVRDRAPAALGRVGAHPEEVGEPVTGAAPVRRTSRRRPDPEQALAFAAPRAIRPLASRARGSIAARTGSPSSRRRRAPSARWSPRGCCCAPASRHSATARCCCSSPDSWRRGAAVAPALFVAAIVGAYAVVLYALTLRWAT